ncbi:signal peptide peptidase-like 2B [Babylonia areolata]|uniref:signal peptide peptidase-like 2B n=1 Tax=Babylonia areolata TaxID=304850 RepID=UPI003FCF8323
MALHLLFWATVFVFFKASAGEIGLIRADFRGSNSSRHNQDEAFCLTYNSYFNPLPTTYIGQPSFPLADYSHYNGCSNVYANISGMVVAVARGNCTFVEKAAIIQEAGGVGALVVDDRDETSRTPPGGNRSEYNAVNITVAIIFPDDFHTLVGVGTEVRVWLYAPNPPRFDPNIIIMFALATLCVVTGAYLSASAHYNKKRRRASREEGQKEEEEEEEEEEKKEESLSLGMGIIMSVLLVVFFCVSLTLLYFFYDYLVYVIIAIFCVAGVNGLFQAFLPLWRRLVPCPGRVPVRRVPCMARPPQVRSLFLVLLCAGFVAVWVVFRHQSFAWILQDIIGFCFCLYVMRALLMPSLRACTVLLGLLFIYDIFFVFITPLFTKNGESVMIKVATGGDSQTGEQMPTVFKMPYLVTWAMSQCFTDKYSLLGYGDVIVPGLLITYNCAFDLRTQHVSQGRWRLLYFTATSVAYTVGLVATGLALYVMKSGQPALLYLVPCTLLTTVLIAACRGELRLMWLGAHCCQCSEQDEDGSGVDPNKNSASVTKGPLTIKDGGRGEEEEEEEEEEEGVSTERQSLIQ